MSFKIFVVPAADAAGLDGKRVYDEVRVGALMLYNTGVYYPLFRHIQSIQRSQHPNKILILCCLSTCTTHLNAAQYRRGIEREMLASSNKALDTQSWT